MTTAEEYLAIATYVIPIGLLVLIAWWFDFRRPVLIGLFVLFAGFVLVTYASDPGFGVGELFGLTVFLGALGWVWFGDA